MAALETPRADIGWHAADFALKGVDGNIHSLHELSGKNGTLIAFICNHCPYVQKQLDRMITLSRELAPLGVHLIAINSNDASQYPDDSFENMQKLAAEKAFPFHYLHDDKQAVATSYGAVCTPDFFGFNRALMLQYRGRLDESWSQIIASPKPELYLAMAEIAEKGATLQPQNPSVGCSIKWKQREHQVA